jgi:hypothetical protein
MIIGLKGMRLFPNVRQRQSAQNIKLFKEFIAIWLHMVNDLLSFDLAVAHTGLAFNILPLHRALPCAVDYALSARWADKRIMFSGILH